MLFSTLEWGFLRFTSTVLDFSSNNGTIMNLNASLRLLKYLVSATLNLIVLAICQFYKTYNRLLYGEHYVQMADTVTSNL